MYQEDIEEWIEINDKKINCIDVFDVYPNEWYKIHSRNSSFREVLEDLPEVDIDSEDISELIAEYVRMKLTPVQIKLRLEKIKRSSPQETYDARIWAYNQRLASEFYHFSMPSGSGL